MRPEETRAPTGTRAVSAAHRAFALGRKTPLAAFVVGALVATVIAGCAGGPEKPTALAGIDRVLVKKSERKMQLVRDGAVVREYRISLGEQPRGHKIQEGDERTPEGDYILDWRNPDSRFHKSIHVSYPNDRDTHFARFMGVDPGGMIMIHGQPNYVRSERIKAEYKRRDWTDGCIAVQNHEMEEIWRAVRDGTPIRILP